jgi:hypothetical protein
MAASMFMNSNSLPIALMQSLVLSVHGLKWTPDDNKNAMLGRALTYLVLYSTLGMMVRCVNLNTVPPLFSECFLGQWCGFIFITSISSLAGLGLLRLGLGTSTSAPKPLFSAFGFLYSFNDVLMSLTASLELRRASTLLCRRPTYSNLSTFTTT